MSLIQDFVSESESMLPSHFNRGTDPCARKPASKNEEEEDEILLNEIGCGPTVNCIYITSGAFK